MSFELFVSAGLNLFFVFPSQQQHQAHMPSANCVVGACIHLVWYDSEMRATTCGIGADHIEGICRRCAGNSRVRYFLAYQPTAAPGAARAVAQMRSL